MPPIEEFVLRSIEHGLTSQDEIAELLGLEEEITAKTLTRMWQTDLIDTQSSSGGRALTLTSQGREAIEELSVTLAQEQEIYFTFDRLLLRPSSRRHGGLMGHRDAEERGYMLIRPANTKTVDLQALKIREVNEAIQAAAGSDFAELLVLKESLRQQLQFLPCSLLVFESDDSKQHAVEVVVDGRLEPEYGPALERLGLAKHLGLQFDQPAAADIAEIEPVRTFELQLPEPSVQTIRRVADLFLAIEVDEVEQAEGGRSSSGSAGLSISTVTGRPAEIEELEIRNIDTFEHPDYFAEALATCEKRLLILSPWIKRSVMDRQLLADLRSVARRNVLIHIGFGDGREDQHDDDAVDRLQKLASEYPNFVVAEVARTHSKILVWDNSQITTSFNWLSFRGDRHRTYRQESGILVKNRRELIDPLWQKEFRFIEQVASKQAKQRL